MPTASPPLRLLALETSGMSGSAASLVPGRAADVVRLPPDVRSARGLSPAVREVLARAGWGDDERPNVVGVTVGPGSFTGLRIGIVTAKALAYAWQADLVAVDTLDVLARQAERIEPAGFTVLHAVLDAHRQELFHARFRRDATGRLRRETASGLIGVEAWLAALRPGDAAIGPIVPKLSARLPAGVLVAPTEFCEPEAGAVAELAAELHAAGRRDDPFQLVPHYGRLAAAEEKRLGTEAR